MISDVGILLHNAEKMAAYDSNIQLLAARTEMGAVTEDDNVLWAVRMESVGDGVGFTDIVNVNFRNQALQGYSATVVF